MIPTIITAGIVLVAVIFVIVLIKSCWKVAGTNEVLIVSGLGKVKKKTGGDLDLDDAGIDAIMRKMFG